MAINFRPVIRHGGPCLPSLTLELPCPLVEDLVQLGRRRNLECWRGEKLGKHYSEYYMFCVQCARIFCFQNNLPLSQKECRDLCQER